MRPPSWTKQPSTKRRLPFDLSKSMIGGDTIVSFEAKIFDGAGSDLSGTMIASSTNTETIVYVWIQGGVTETTYFLRLRVTTTLGEIIEDDLVISVVEKYK